MELVRGSGRAVLCVAAVLAGLLGLATSASAQARRTALVIGNGGYRGGLPALVNPRNDATAIATVLQGLGFDVLLMMDAARSDLLDALAMLAQRSRGAEVTLLFYAGHAVEVNGRNLLVGVAARMPDSVAELEREAVGFDEIERALLGKARATLVFLDACRDSPFAAGPGPGPGPGSVSGTTSRSLGRSVVSSAGGLSAAAGAAGALFAYATAPGRTASDGVGGHSPFTTALLQSLPVPDTEVRTMLTSVRRLVRESTGGSQVPWDSSSLEGPLVLASPSLPAGRVMQIMTAASRLAPNDAAAAAASAPAPNAAQPLPAARTPPRLASPPAAPPEPMLVPVRLPALPSPLCRVQIGRGWVTSVGTGAIRMARNGEPCGGQLFSHISPPLPATNLRVDERPRHGSIVMRGNAFAYRPDPGFVGEDRFTLQASGAGGGSAMMGVMTVTIE